MFVVHTQENECKASALLGSPWPWNCGINWPNLFDMVEDISFTINTLSSCNHDHGTYIYIHIIYIYIYIWLKLLGSRDQVAQALRLGHFTTPSRRSLRRSRVASAVLPHEVHLLEPPISGLQASHLWQLDMGR